jgi:hypothetical protein
MGGTSLRQQRSTLFAARPAGGWISGARADALPAECAAVLILCPLLLSVAWWNGFPITFYDTGAYLEQGLNGTFLPERSSVYSFFLRFAGAATSLWLIVLVQALMTAFVIVETTRAEAPRLPLWALLGMGALLAAATGLPWYAGQIEPDCMTAIAVLATYLVSFRSPQLGYVRSALLVLVAALATATHPSHLGLTAGLAIFVILVRLGILLLHGRGIAASPKPALAILVFALGLGLVLLGNRALTGRLFISETGAVFVFGRLLQDGIVKRLLDETCPGSGYALCTYKDDLPETADVWLWGAESPFLELDRFDGTRAESKRIIADTLRRYPWMQAETALAATASQFVSFATGDQIEPQQWILYPDFQRLLPDQLSDYMEARQQIQPIDFDAINRVHTTVAVLSLGGMLFLMGWNATRRRWEAVALPAFILVALIGNAMICGALSNPHDRYQSRVIWLPTLVVALGMGRAAAKIAVRKWPDGTKELL